MMGNRDKQELMRGIREFAQNRPNQVYESVPKPSEISSQTQEDKIDALFTRLSSKQEGIQYKIDEHWISAPFGPLDRYIFKRIALPGIGPKKIAFGFPRVPLGISTWLSVAVMISRIALYDASKSQGPTGAGGLSRWILVACRERLVRDLYLSQRIKLSQRSFLIDQFPIYRLKRNGSLQPISNAVPNELSTPVIFYHYDMLDSIKSAKSLIGIRLTIGEISESDTRLSSAMLERLEKIQSPISNPKTFIFFNSFDDQVREILGSNGYEIINIRPENEINTRIANLPTVNGIFSRYSSEQKVILDVVNDNQGISEALFECASDLHKVSEAAKGNEGRGVIARWWNTWRILKDLSIPLADYERYRIHAQRRGSLENAIAQIAKSADRLETQEGRMLKLVAPTISNRLKAIYQTLSVNCPKACRLLSILKQSDNKHDPDSLIILAEKSQVQALRERFLFTDTDLLNKNIPISYLAKAAAAARSMQVANCILPGVWAPWHDSVLLAVGAATLQILMYPYEATVIKTRLHEHHAECEHLAKCLIVNKSYSPILVLPVEQERALAAIKEKEEKRAKLSEPPLWLEKEPEYAIDQLEDEDRLLGEDHQKGRIVIRFLDGACQSTRPHSEIMLVTDEGVETVFANTLSKGDTIALMKGDVAGSIFHSILDQVNHLVRADERVIDLWRSSIKAILSMAPYRGTKVALSLIINTLHDMGCKRVDITIRQWFRGVTMAPDDVEDIRRILDLAKVQRSTEIARVVSREIEVIRTFNRRLGRRIRGQIRASVTGEIVPAKERLDFEIDEAIEAIEYKEIASIDITDGEN